MIPGHQKMQVTSLVVFHPPGCPVIGELWWCQGSFSLRPYLLTWGHIIWPKLMPFGEFCLSSIISLELHLGMVDHTQHSGHSPVWSLRITTVLGKFPLHVSIVVHYKTEDNYCDSASLFVCSYPNNLPFWSISESRSGLVIVSPSHPLFEPPSLTQYGNSTSLTDYPQTLIQSLGENIDSWQKGGPMEGTIKKLIWRALNRQGVLQIWPTSDDMMSGNELEKFDSWQGCALCPSQIRWDSG